MNSDYEKQIEEQAASMVFTHNGYVLFAMLSVFITGTAIGCWIYEVYHG